MPTGFQKFADKALKEEPISINPATKETKTPEQKEIKKFATVTRAGVGERKEEVSAQVNERRQMVEQVPEQKEELFQITIKIRPSTKDKLDWLKFTQKKKFMELAEEAFEDIYKKYGGK